MPTMQYDTIYDERKETLQDVLTAAEVKYGVTAKVIAEHGPGCGWPVVEWEGSREALTRVARDLYDNTPGEAEELAGLDPRPYTVTVDLTVTPGPATGEYEDEEMRASQQAGAALEVAVKTGLISEFRIVNVQ